MLALLYIAASLLNAKSSQNNLRISLRQAKKAVAQAKNQEEVIVNYEKLYPTGGGVTSCGYKR